LIFTGGCATAELLIAKIEQLKTAMNTGANRVIETSGEKKKGKELNNPW